MVVMVFQWSWLSGIRKKIVYYIIKTGCSSVYMFETFALGADGL